MKTVDVWFEFGSTYAYLTVNRAEEIAATYGLGVVWRPFLLGPILRKRGMETSPFVLDPIKGDYMWRDVSRRAESLGLQFSKPPIFPMNSVKAARITLAAEGQPWRGSFAKAVFAAEFVRGSDISDQAVLAGCLKDVGADASTWLARGQTEDVKSKLREQTDEAERIGIFGSPSVVVGDELFWGDDRLEDALDWCVRHRQA